MNQEQIRPWLPTSDLEHEATLVIMHYWTCSTYTTRWSQTVKGDGMRSE
uniref:Uncharacterized protein n=1 Tax=Anguilla anguilla TaxID=7936 RepID=A0A0E9PLJ3_ANGAN